MNNVLKLMAVFVLSSMLTVCTTFFFYPIRNISLLVFITAFIVISFITYLFFKWKPFLTTPLEEKNKKGFWLSLTSVLLSSYFLVSIKGEQIHLEDNSVFVNGLTHIFTLLFIYFTISITLSLLLRFEFSTREQKKTSMGRFMVYFIPILLVLLTYWVAFFPAGMTPDSLAQWDQAHTKDFNDWHPIIFTWIIMLLTGIWDSPAIISLLQIIVISSIVSYCMLQFERIGVSKKFLYTVTAGFLILPVSGIFPIIIWKDVLYSAFLLLFSIHVFNIVYTRGHWLNNTSSIIGMLSSSFGLVFFRHNGLPVFIVVMLFLLVIYRKKLKVLAPLFIAIVGAYFILTGPIFKALDVTPSDPNEALSIPTQQIALIVINNGEMTLEEKEYINDIFPLELWKERYNPYNTNPIKFSWEEYDRDIIFEDFGKYVKTWLSLWWKNPAIAFEAFFDQTSLVWQINQPEDGYTDTYVTNIYYGNEFGLVDKVIIPSVTEQVASYLEKTKELLGFVIWRPAIYLSLILLFSVVSIARNGWKYGLVSMPIILNILSVMAALPAQDFRYLYANTLVVFLLFLMMFVSKKADQGELKHE
ncbi:DUF6020 family protein [Rossellomorea sp. KS-H15a]|uniref:DUF6020 family protein n=1 Tax=Rossellomorea sp. KS-H15a TaxID=2963940 RepID=UPI0020C6168F|nr:DUF6020 family protein [Rossellomorea sp. KS-H15a]UTE77341.1 DUF6020 family protein [Rossellomorea sp. KS-H15a]